MEYNCQRCGFVFKRRDYLVNHLKKKYPCDPLVSDISTEDALKQLCKKLQNPDDCVKCTYCDKLFTSRQGKYQHKSRCKKKPQSADEKILELSEKLKALENQIQNNQVQHVNNTTNNTTNNNIQNNNIQNNIINVQLRDFGCENMDALPKDLIRSLFMNLQFRELIENLHCDPDFPENHNVRIKSVKRHSMEIFRNNKWDITSFVNGLNELLMQGHRIFKEFYKKNKNDVAEDMDENELEEVLDKLDQIEKLNTSAIKPLHQELQFLLETYKNQSLST